MPDLTISIEPRGLAELVAKFGRVTSLQVLRVPMTQGLALLHNDLATYPTASHNPQPFKSERSRRWFFAALRDGRLTVPYRRTGNLGRSWTSEISEGADSLLGVVGNVRSYAPWVQSADQRSSYFEGSGWVTDEQAFNRRKDQIVNMFTEAIDKALAG